MVANEDIIDGHRVITCVAPPIAAAARPGHFVNILAGSGTDPFLRKPFSIYTVDRKRGEISILYAIVGGVTRAMTARKAGDEIDLVGPLGGRLFTPDTRPRVTHIMVGGGYGVPPLVFLARELRATDPAVSTLFLMGARRSDLLLCDAELLNEGFDVRVTTEDGSRGTHGRVTDALDPILLSPYFSEPKHGTSETIVESAAGGCAVYCCGPAPMMRAVGDMCIGAGVPCQVSVEVPMPCGLGVCMGCVVDLTDGRRVRSCTDGPVFGAEEVIW